MVTIKCKIPRNKRRVKKQPICRVISHRKGLSSTLLKKNTEAILRLMKVKPKRLNIHIGTPRQIPRARFRKGDLGRNITRSDGTTTIYVNSRALKTNAQISNVIGHELAESSLMLKDFKKYNSLRHRPVTYHNRAIDLYPDIFKITRREAKWDWWVKLTPKTYGL